MPEYEVTSPDGKTYRVNAPEGASEQDVLAYAQSHHTATAAPHETYSPVGGGTNKYFNFLSGKIEERPNNAIDTLAEGIGSGMVRFGRGLGNLVVKGLNA